MTEIMIVKITKERAKNPNTPLAEEVKEMQW
jgi:hypothetical protein